MPLQAYVNYAMGPPKVTFTFRVGPPTDMLICVGICSSVCFLLSGTMLDAIHTSGDSAIVYCAIAAFWSIPMIGICADR